MRLTRPLSVLAGAVLLLAASAASAQSNDGPVSTAGSSAGGVPVASKSGEPAPVRETPPAPPVQPVRDLSAYEAAADQGRRAPLLGEYHGEVGGVVGTNGLRGVYGRIVSRPTDNMSIDLRFSTIHQNGYPYGGIYDRRDRYRPDLEGLSADPILPPGH